MSKDVEQTKVKSKLGVVVGMAEEREYYLSWDENENIPGSPTSGASRCTSISISQASLEDESSMALVRKLLLRCGVESLPCLVDSGSGTSEPRVSAGVFGESATDLFGLALEKHNACDWVAAAALFSRAVALDPAHTKARFNLASLCQMLELPTLAVHQLAQVLLREPDDMTSHAFLWALTQSAQTASPELLPCCVRAYKALAAAGDLKASHKLATLTGEGQTSRKGDPNYARQIYDDMGSCFEGKLVDHLGYRGPWQLHEMLLELLAAEQPQESGSLAASVWPPMGAWRVLDLGCGSGLCGKVFAALSSDNVALLSGPAAEPAKPDDITGLLDVAKAGSGAFMAGVDVSSRMVDITRAGGCYHSLACCDLQAALGTFRGSELDLVLVADTFIYVGALGSTFAAVRRALRRGGLFAFSTEDLEASPMRSVPPMAECGGDSPLSVTVPAQAEDSEDIPGAVPGWGAALLTSARFAHSVRYIQDLAAMHALQVLRRKEVVLRTESTVPLAGQLFVLVAV